MEPFSAKPSPTDKPTENSQAQGDPYKTLFIARLVGTIFYPFILRSGAAKSCRPAKFSLSFLLDILTLLGIFLVCRMLLILFLFSAAKEGDRDGLTT